MAAPGSVGLTDRGTAGLEQAFEALAQSFACAGDRLAINVRRVRVGAQLIELRIAGDAMTAIVTQALQHLIEPRRPADQPDLTIDVWDTAGSDTRLPDLPGIIDGPVGQWHYDGHICLSLRMADGVISALDGGRARAVHCVADATRIAPYDVAHPLSELIAWWLSRTDCYRVHAAAVGTPAGGVLLAGAGGAGKSTSALTCLRAGMDFAGDDTVLIRPAPPVAISLYNSGRADHNLLARYPDAFPRLEQPSGDEKVVGFFSPEAMTRAIDLRAVVLPQVVAGSRCELGPGSRAAALRALAPWPVLHSPGRGEQALSAVRRLLAALPVHALRIGDDLHRIPVLLSAVIDGAGSCS